MCAPDWSCASKEMKYYTVHCIVFADSLLYTLSSVLFYLHWSLLYCLLGLDLKVQMSCLHHTFRSHFGNFICVNKVVINGNFVEWVSLYLTIFMHCLIFLPRDKNGNHNCLLFMETEFVIHRFWKLFSKFASHCFYVFFFFFSLNSKVTKTLQQAY